MRRSFFQSRPAEGESFDMTPVIDVVFLLIIFFMLVCQFIAADRFRVEVPDQIASALPPRRTERPLTLTVLPDERDGVIYAAGGERLRIDNPEDIAAILAAAIDGYFLDASPTEPRTVRLRCDQSVTFGRIKPVLRGIAQSTATDVDWAVRTE